MADAHSIECPDCGTPIPYEAESLTSGQSFACPGCGTQIALTSQSSAEWTRAKDAFAALKDMQLGAKGGAG